MTFKEDELLKAIYKLNLPHIVEDCEYYKKCNKGCLDKCIGCGSWIRKYIPNAPRSIINYDWESEVINMAETTVNVNIEKKYFGDYSINFDLDFEEISDKHKETVAALIKKYKEEDKKNWLDKNYPVNDKNVECRQAILHFVNDLLSSLSDLEYRKLFGKEDIINHIKKLVSIDKVL